jgi:hypothetical protein
VSHLMCESESEWDLAVETAPYPWGEATRCPRGSSGGCVEQRLRRAHDVGHMWRWTGPDGAECRDCREACVGRFSRSDRMGRDRAHDHGGVTLASVDMSGSLSCGGELS